MIKSVLKGNAKVLNDNMEARYYDQQFGGYMLVKDTDAPIPVFENVVNIMLAEKKGR